MKIEPIRARPEVAAELEGASAETAQARLAAEREIWARERARLLAMLAHQQRIAQSGLVTSSLAHDVRNHIQVIMGSAELSLLKKDPNHWNATLQSISTMCADVTETTKAFVSFAQRRTASEGETFTMSSVVEHCGRLGKSLARTRGVPITYEVRGDGVVRGARRLAIQALVNLASNAVKACAESGGEVSLVASRPRPEICRFTVRDTGPGVPEHIRARLFRPFAGTNEATGGGGIGLFIVRRVVRDLHGTIHVKTSPSGTTFRIDLPAVVERAG